LTQIGAKTLWFCDLPVSRIRRMGGGRANGVFGRWGTRHPRLADRAARVSLPFVKRFVSWMGFVSLDSRAGRELSTALEEALRQGREAYVLGVGIGFHNSGAALVRVTPGGTVELVCNEEEERYIAVKHTSDYPEHSLAALRARMDELGIGAGDIVACVSTWDYAQTTVMFGVRSALEEAPAALRRPLVGEASEAVSDEILSMMRTGPARLARQLGFDGKVPIVSMRHHDSHAYFSYAVSPFARQSGSTIVMVLDGSGDDASSSFYVARDGRLELLRAESANALLDSLGMLYGFLSSTQGGWPLLSSEGRFMGAAAWGDGDRLSNRFYRRLRQIVYFGPDGEVHVNRELANWLRAGWDKPYTDALIDILGEPIPFDRLWNPDAVLNVEDVRHPEVTRDRVDKAAAVQMVFEDALTHMVEHLIRETGSDRLVLTGGTALNCVANMRLLDCFDADWYERQLGREDTFLRIWVPPTPGDAGTPVGAAYAFAMLAGARPGSPLQHAFYCGVAPAATEIEAALSAEPALESMPLGDCSDPQRRALVADLLAYLLAGDRIIGLYQGGSETGPRALGHRSILANPCNPDTRRLLNERVKHRELIRPLAPMLTRAAAERLFELQPGAADDDYNAYNYMVLTARARPEARELVPAVIHEDGTGRIQIVRPEVDPFCHDFLLAMGRRTGVEASVNTSLNVGAPIAHTPEQAVETLKRAKGMDGLLTIGAERQATLVWLGDRPEARERLLESVRGWAAEIGFELPDAALAAMSPA
jgi:carbamoyltransferase